MELLRATQRPAGDLPEGVRRAHVSSSEADCVALHRYQVLLTDSCCAGRRFQKLMGLVRGEVDLDNQELPKFDDVST